MPQQSEDQLGSPEGTLISVPLGELDTDDLLAMDNSLKRLIEYRVWPESREHFIAARKTIGSELLSRSL